MLLNSGSGALSRNAAGSKEDLHAQDSRCSSKYNKIFTSMSRYIKITSIQISKWNYYENLFIYYKLTLEKSKMLFFMKDLWQKEKLWIHSKKVFKLRDSRASASANPGSASVYDNVKVQGTSLSMMMMIHIMMKCVFVSWKIITSELSAGGAKWDVR